MLGVKLNVVGIGINVLSLAALSVAAGEEQGITVVGTGSVSGRPSAVEVRARVSGVAELGGDALVKYRDHKRQTLAAVEGLKLKNLNIETGGTRVSFRTPTPDADDDGDPRRRTPRKPLIEFSSTLRLAYGGIGEMPEDQVMQAVSRLADTLHDAGAQIVAPGILLAEDSLDVAGGFSDAAEPLAVFVIDSAAELRERARQRAFAAARRRADRLAQLASARLGPLVALKEVETFSSEGLTRAMMADAALMAPAADEPTRDRVYSPAFAETPVRVSLQARFKLERPP